MSMLHIDPSLLYPAATLVLGVAVAFIGWRQWLLARHRFRLDLFEKRYKVYESARQFLAVILSRADFSDEDLRAFNIGTLDAVFLYPKHVKDYLQEIRCRALDMRLFQAQFTPLPCGEKRSKLVQKNHDESIWLNDQLTKLPDIFEPFLGFASVRYGRRSGAASNPDAGFPAQMNRNPHSITIVLAALGSLVLAALPVRASVSFSNGTTGTFTEASNASGTAYQANVLTNDLINGMTPATTGWNTAGGASPNRLTDGLNGASDNSGGQVEGGWTTVGASATYTLGSGANGLGYNITSIQSIASWPNAGFGNQGWIVSVRLLGGSSFTNVGTVNYQPFTTSGGSSTRVVLSDLNITGIDAIRFTASQVNNGTNVGAFVWREIDVVGAATPPVVDRTPPALVSVTPRNNSDLVPAGVSLAALFDEKIALGTGSITITNTTTGQPMVLTLPDSRVSVSARTLVIQPGLLVTPSAHYAVRVGSGVVVDLSGNAYTGINDDSTWNFTSAAPDVKVTAVGETAYLNDANPADLLQGLTATTTGWNTDNGAHPSKLTDGSGGLSFVDAGNTVDGAWTTVGATAVYQLGVGANGTGYDIFSLQSIASWTNVAFGNQAWTMEVKPVNGSYNTLTTVNYQPLTTGGSTKVVKSGASGALASGIESIRITASQVNGGNNAGAFVWRELDVFGQSSAAVVNDGQAPVLVSLAPVTNATGVAPDSTLVATFDKNIVAGTGSVLIRNLDTVQETPIPVADSRISFSGKKLTITPSSRLSTFAHYALRIDAGAVKDSFSNVFAGITDDTTWQFTTGKVRLRIMPMGDSITAGYTDNPNWNVPYWYGYRSGLYNRLHAADYNFVFVGQATELPIHIFNLATESSGKGKAMQANATFVFSTERSREKLRRSEDQ